MQHFVPIRLGGFVSVHSQLYAPKVFTRLIKRLILQTSKNLHCTVNQGQRVTTKPKRQPSDRKIISEMTAVLSWWFMAMFVCGLRRVTQDSSSECVGLERSWHGRRTRSACSRRLPGISRQFGLDGRLPVRSANTTQHYDAGDAQHGCTRRVHRCIFAAHHTWLY